MLEDVGDVAHVCAQSEARLTKLERRVRILQMVLIVMSAILAIWWVPDEEPGPLETTVFRLLDEDGTCRGSLGTNSDGCPVLTLADDQGTPRVFMSVTPEGKAQIGKMDEEGKPEGICVFVELDEEGRALVDPLGALERRVECIEELVDGILTKALDLMTELVDRKAG